MENKITRNLIIIYLKKKKKNLSFDGVFSKI